MDCGRWKGVRHYQVCPGASWRCTKSVYSFTCFAPTDKMAVIYAYAGRDASQAYNEIHEPNLIKSNLLPEEVIGDLDPTTSFPDASTSSGSALPQKQGAKPSLDALLNLNDFEEAAQHSISKKSWAFIFGASNDNITRDANKNFFQKIWFRPRTLRNVATVSTKGSMLGCNVSLPIWISPTGVGKAGGPEGEIALSKAAAETGIIQTVSPFPVQRPSVLILVDIDQFIVPIDGDSRRCTGVSVLLSAVH